MRHRIEVATDVAKIGAWDASGTAEPYYVEIGGDWGGAVDVFVNESAPAAVMRHGAKLAAEGSVSVPSGRLIIAGGEDYAAATPRTTGPDSAIDVPPGEYRVRSYLAEVDETDEAGEMSIPQAEDRLEPSDRDYYRARSRADLRVGLIGYTLFLLFPILAFPLGWKIALGVTAAVVAAYFGIFVTRSERRLKADERYQRINKQLERIFLHGQRAPLVIELFGLAEGQTLHVAGADASTKVVR